jgi:methionine-gamma-lyase
MSNETYRKTHIGAHALQPQTQMLSYGYDPALSEGAVKPPVFLTSTFTFPSADAGRHFFDLATGRVAGGNAPDSGLVYARYNHPNAQIVEDRLALFEGAEGGAVFASGMAAIATAVLAHVRPGDVLLVSQPIYGGTDALFNKVLPGFGIVTRPLPDACCPQSLRRAVAEAEAAGRLAMIFLETPANPLTTLADIALAVTVAGESAGRQGHRPLVAVDNTLLGPLFQQPLRLGADLSIYSLTKYVGGHSDLIAGGVLGGRAALTPVRQLRALLGGSLDPHSCWMLSRSLETLTLRMARAAENALAVAQWLAAHAMVRRVHFPALLSPESAQGQLFRRQCQGAGALLSFEVADQAAAFALLDRLTVIKLAVSLGGTESLVCHPATTVQSGLTEAERRAIGITPGLIRLAVGIEAVGDLMADLAQAFGS